MKTTAAVCRAFGQPLVIEEIEIAEPGSGEILVKLAACAICHSDISYADGAWGGDLPAVYGHEAAGIVERVGAGVSHIKSGDSVVVTLIRSCGHCVACADGAPVFCEEVFALDARSPITSKSGETLVHGMRTGAFAEYVVVEASQAVAIDPAVPLDSAALIACGVLTGMGAVINTAGVKAGAHIVVIGCGGVGLNSIQGAKLAGAATIIGIDNVPSKLEAARAFGATHTINAASENVAEKVSQWTLGRKADFVFVTVGAKSAVEQSLTLIKRNGAAVIVGMPASGVMCAFDPGWLAADGQRILGSKMGSARIQIDVPNIVALYKQGRIKLDELISGRYPLARINEAITSVKRGEALRNVVVF